MMKHKFTPVLCTVLAVSGLVSAAPAFAADDVGAFGIGVHGGVNLNDLNVDKNVSSTISATESSGTGPVVGLHFEFGTSQFMIRPEINYSVHKYTLANVADVSHKYIEIPVLFKFALLPSPIQPFLEIGPQFGFHLSDDTTALGTTTTYNDSAHTMNVAGVGGAGLRLDLVQNLAIEAEGRYVFGITDLSSNNDFTVKTRGFQVLGGLTVRY